MITYERKYSADEVEVAVIGGRGAVLTDTLQRGLREYSARYGFSLLVAEDEGALYRVRRRHLNHLIWLAGTSYDLAICERAAEYLQLFDTVSLAFIYDSTEEMERAGREIERLKNRWNGRVNFLRPDVQRGGRLQVSEQKILDNAVCDSVRVKYIPDQKKDRVPADLREEVRPFFMAASYFYQRYALYHRDVHDGYFACRTQDGFAITATKTNKVVFDDARIVIVHNYDERRNILTYTGPFLPSSDAVEAYFVFANHPTVQTVVHTHASVRWTRNRRYAQRIKVPPSPYGTPDTGRQVAIALAETPDGFVIMAEHGEIFTNVPGLFSSAVENLQWHCEHPA